VLGQVGVLPQSEGQTWVFPSHVMDCELPLQVAPEQERTTPVEQVVVIVHAAALTTGESKRRLPIQARMEMRWVMARSFLQTWWSTKISQSRLGCFVGGCSFRGEGEIVGGGIVLADALHLDRGVQNLLIERGGEVLSSFEVG
jgi:hypothetical protein